ncbi:MAG: hypothetical protein IT443_09410 [Phycisphaeraceae bacterium]|nr:hypothetical protein [Phycisphaeraceae bacterium]
MPEGSNTTRPGRWAGWWVLAAIAVAVLAARIGGPSDLDLKDQPKTVSYTADVVANGRWIWPRDVMGTPTYKPPLYNWLSVPGVLLLGWDEWVLKLPSILAGLATAVVCVCMARWMAQQTRSAECRMPNVECDPASPVVANRRLHLPLVICHSLIPGIIAGVVWLANGAVYRLIYVARPDMLVGFFVVLSWALGTVLLSESQEKWARRQWAMAIGLWVSVGCAALTKGTPALLVLIYLLLAAWWRNGSWRALKHAGIVWGLPLALAMFAVWLVPAWVTIPPGWGQTLAEVEGGRIVKGGVVGWLLTTYQMPWYFLLRFLPWSRLFFVGVVVVIKQGWRKHPLTPAILWVVLVLAFFSIPVLKRDDYLLPAYAGAAVLVGWLIQEAVKRWPGAGKWLPGATVAVALIFLAVSVANDFWWKPQTKDRMGDRVKEFAQVIRQETAGSRRIVFVKTGYHPLQALLGMNQGTIEPTPAQLAQAQWVVMPLPLGGDGAAAVAISKPLPRVIDKKDPAALGLYRVPKTGE